MSIAVRSMTTANYKKISENTNLDEYELIDLPLEQLDSPQEHKGVAAAPTAWYSTSGWHFALTSLIHFEQFLIFFYFFITVSDVLTTEVYMIA